MKITLWLIILATGVLTFVFILNGINSSNGGEVALGCLCGLISLFMIFAEGESNGA